MTIIFGPDGNPSCVLDVPNFPPPQQEQPMADTATTRTKDAADPKEMLRTAVEGLTAARQAFAEQYARDATQVALLNVMAQVTSAMQQVEQALVQANQIRA